MKTIKITVNEKVISVAEALKIIKLKEGLSNEQIGKECGLSLTTIGNIIAKKDFINNTSTRKIINYVNWKLVPEQKVKEQSAKELEPTIAKKSTRKGKSGKLNDDQLLELYKVIEHLQESGYPVTKIKTILDISNSTVSRIKKLYPCISLDTYSRIISNYKSYVSSKDTEDQSMEKVVIKTDYKPEDIISAVNYFKGKGIKGVEIQEKFNISQSWLSRLMSGNYQGKLRVSNLGKVYRSELFKEWVSTQKIEVNNTEITDNETDLKNDKETVKEYKGNLSLTSDINPLLLIKNAKLRLSESLEEIIALEKLLETSKSTSLYSTVRKEISIKIQSIMNRISKEELV